MAVKRKTYGTIQSSKSQEVRNAEDLLVISITTLVIALPTKFFIPAVIIHSMWHFYFRRINYWVLLE